MFDLTECGIEKKKKSEKILATVPIIMGRVAKASGINFMKKRGKRKKPTTGVQV